MARPLECMPREHQALLAEGLDRGRGRTHALERTQQLPHAVLDAQVRVQTDAALRVMNESDGQAHLEFTAARLVQDAAPQAGLEHVQLRFAHGLLQAQQQAVVEVRRVVHAVFVQDERVSKRADFQQTMPVG